MFEADFNRAAEFADTANKKMTELGIPASPANFTVWYHYFAGLNPDLTKTIDVLTSNGEEIDEKHCQDLYEQFFTNRNEAEEARKAGAAIEESINKVLALIGDASSSTGEYGKTIAGLSGDISESATPQDLQNAVQGILTETKRVLEQNSSLEDQLGAQAREVETLRENLEEVQKEAETDGLTGIANRKRLDNFMSAQVVDAMENDQPLCLLLTDVDRFKKFNDTYGHRVGDQVLKVVAKMLAAKARDHDLAARYGGEEFCLVLPQTELDAAAEIAESIRIAVGAKTLKSAKTGENYGNVTLSLGVSQFRPGESIADWVNRADEALYSAKNTGRNKVITETAVEELKLAG